MMKKVVLAKGRERSVKKAHPWIFSGAVKSSDASSGETVEVLSSEGKRLGFGWYSSESILRVRMLVFGEGEFPSSLLRERVFDSVGRRANFYADAYTDAFRLINAENDLLPGVVVDKYGDFAICQFTCAGADANKNEIASLVMEATPGVRGVMERLDNDSRAKEGLPVEPRFSHLAGESVPKSIKIKEGPCSFYVDAYKGHKTGFYLDQRDARRVVGSLANGKKVLNCFCYTGGFGLYAGAAGAEKVVQVDSSAEALAMAKRNESLVELCGTKMEYVETDVFRYLRECRDAGVKFDMIILDPPKFASSKAALMKAARGYKDINLLAMKLLSPHGTLATFSCSGAMDAAFFDKILAEASCDAERSFQVIARTSAGPDHPVSVSFPEGSYLKGVIMNALN